MFTKNFLFGMNIVSLAGFALMGVGLTLSRQRRIGVPAAFGLMGAGTALLVLGLYVAAP
jgi:hypothetical protein